MSFILLPNRIGSVRVIRKFSKLKIAVGVGYWDPARPCLLVAKLYRLGVPRHDPFKAGKNGYSRSRLFT